MAERLPVGTLRNAKSSPFTSFGLPASQDVSNASIDHGNGQIASSQEPDTNGLNSQVLSNGPSFSPIRNASYNKQGQLEVTSRNGIRTKESESNHEAEWVEQDEPGVYITLTSLPGGVKDLKRVRFRYVFLSNSVV